MMEHVAEPGERIAVSHDATVSHLLSGPDVVQPVVPRGVDSCILLLTSPTLRPIGLLTEPLVHAGTINSVRFGEEEITLSHDSTLRERGKAFGTEVARRVLAPRKIASRARAQK